MIELLKPQFINSPKIRLGPSIDRDNEHGDGGYVTPVVMLEKSSALFTYGVAQDMRYEVEYAAKYNKPAYLFDHTVDHPSAPAPGLFFFKEGLGKNIAGCREFLEHYKDLNIKGDVLLKIDIEGGEFDYFNQTDLAGMSLVTTGLILEVHWLDNEINQKKFISMLERLREFFVLTHIHGNNDRGTFIHTEQLSNKKFISALIPIVLEITFTNKRLVNCIIPDKEKYPIKGLDLRCWAAPGAQDHNLHFLTD